MLLPSTQHTLTQCWIWMFGNLLVYLTQTGINKTPTKSERIQVTIYIYIYIYIYIKFHVSIYFYWLIINTNIMHPDFWIETHFSGYQLGSDTTRGYLSSYVYQPHQSCTTTPNYHSSRISVLLLLQLGQLPSNNHLHLFARSLFLINE